MPLFSLGAGYWAAPLTWTPRRHVWGAVVGRPPPNGAPLWWNPVHRDTASPSDSGRPTKSGNRPSASFSRPQGGASSSTVHCTVGPQAAQVHRHLPAGCAGGWAGQVSSAAAARGPRPPKERLRNGSSGVLLKGWPWGCCVFCQGCSTLDPGSLPAMRLILAFVHACSLLTNPTTVATVFASSGEFQRFQRPQIRVPIVLRSGTIDAPPPLCPMRCGASLAA